MTLFTGSCTAMITPFTEDGVDFEAYGRLIDFQIENGTSAIVVAGTTGEPATMTAKEKEDLIRFAIEYTQNRIPVIASTGGNNTAAVIEASKKAEEAGADALLVVTPYYNKATQKGLIAHYTAVADAVHTPIIVYNVPSRTSVNLLPGTFAELAKHKNIIALKDACGNMAQSGETLRLCRDYADVYCGEDALTVPMMSMGAKGVVSVISNLLPAETSAMTAAALSGDFAAAREYQFRLDPLIDALFCEVSPIPAKTAAELMGLCSGRLRLPLCPMEEANRQRLIAAMKGCGIVF